MKRITQMLVRLYPRSWRGRYEDEFTALLEDVPPNWRNSIDLLKGAIVMQATRVSWVKGGAFVLTIGLAGLLVGMATAGGMTKEYQSTSLSLVPAGLDDASEKDVSDRMQVMARNVLSRSTLGALIQEYRLYPGEMARMPLEDVERGMQDEIVIAPVATNPTGARAGTHPIAFVVRFRYPDPVVAQKVVRDLMGRFGGEILDPASLPKTPVSPNVRSIASVGLLMGLVLGLGVLMVRGKNKKAA